jgi:hypothetical protein
LLPTGYTDRDRDGYTTDCDDTDPAIFDGIYTTKGCTGGEYRKCNGSTYTACTSATLCESGAGGTCYYVNPTTGNNANAGTFASPFADLRKVSLGYAGGVTLNAGDVIYLVGSGTITQTALLDGSTNAFYSWRSGAAGNPITLKQYPGSTVSISVTDAQAVHLIYPARYWKIEGIRATNNNSDKSVLRLNSARDTELRLNYVYDSYGNGLDNSSGIYHSITWDDAQHESVHIHNNYIKNYRHNGTGGIDNVTSILIMNNDNDGDNEDIKVRYNRSWDTDSATILSGPCIKRKHGLQTAADIGAPIQITDNYCLYGKTGVSFSPGSINVERNLTYGARDTGMLVMNDDTQTARDTTILYNSSLLTDRNLVLASFLSAATDNIVYQYNVHTSSRTGSYVGSGANLICYSSGDCVAPKPDVSTTANTDIYEANNNCYHNANIPIKFAWFATTGGGANLDFSSYKTYTGNDELNSFVEDPTLDSYLRASSTNCLSKGWLVSGETIGGPVNTWGISPLYLRIW